MVYSLNLVYGLFLQGKTEAKITWSQCIGQIFTIFHYFCLRWSKSISCFSPSSAIWDFCLVDHHEPVSVINCGQMWPQLTTFDNCDNLLFVTLWTNFYCTRDELFGNFKVYGNPEYEIWPHGIAQEAWTPINSNFVFHGSKILSRTHLRPNWASLAQSASFNILTMQPLVADQATMQSSYPLVASSSDSST